MTEPRLDPLKYPDETKVGLALLVVYMLVDATQTYSMGGWHTLRWLRGADPGLGATGLLQFAGLVLLASAMMAWRVRALMRTLGLQPIGVSDPTAAAGAEYLGSRIARGKPRFFVTANMNDTNAFCLWAGKSPWIVLGGGLRLLFRKKRGRAMALVAHECAHVEAGDTVYVLAAWHLFNAYALLTIGYLLAMQAAFWWRVPNVLGGYEQAGTGLWGLVGENAPYIFRRGFPGLIALPGVALILSHFVRLREYMADERASQYGLREPLVALLQSLENDPGRRSWARFLTFHPSARERIARLLKEGAWARFDPLFLAGMAFLATRLDDYLQVSSDELRRPNDFDDAIALVSRSLGNAPAFAASVALGIFIAFVFTLHIYRASSSQLKLGSSVWERLSCAFGAFIAIFVGGFVGLMTSQKQLIALSDAQLNWTFVNAVDASFFAGALLAGVSLLLMVSVILVVPRMQRRPAGKGLSQICRLGAWTFAALMILQFLGSVAASGISYFLGQHIQSWPVTWLPESSKQPFPGFPSIFQAFVLVAAAVWALRFAKFLRRPSMSSQAPNIDSSWLVIEQPSTDGR